MKKISLVFILMGVVFSSLGSGLYIDSKKNDKELVNDIPIMIEKVKSIADRSIVVVDLNNKLNNSLESMDRNSYNEVLEEISKIEYSDIKELMIEKAEEVNKKITLEEEKILRYTAKETLVGNVSAFTAYCSDGCNGYTASGRYIGNSIYYNDKDYGRVRIVAADKSYPFGTIVRFNNLSYYGEEVYAIVLDRGGAVGKNKKVLFDLLLSNEKSADDFGIERKITCDILRIGY